MNSVPENFDLSAGQPAPVKIVSPKQTVTIASIRKNIQQTTKQNKPRKPEKLNDFIGVYYVRETNDQRNKLQAEKFNTAPEYEKITNSFFLPEKAQKLLEIYEIRAAENNGDTKFYDKRAAEILGVSTRHIINLKNLLRAHNLISTYTEIVHNKMGQPRTLQTIRCWRIVYEKHFQIRTNPNWKNDFRPKVTMDDFANVPLPWKIAEPKKINGKVVQPVFTDTFDLYMKYKTGLSEEHGHKIHVLKDMHFDHKEDRSVDNKPALDILGYPEEYRCIRGGLKMSHPEYLNHLFESDDFDEDAGDRIPPDFYESEYTEKEWAEVRAEREAESETGRRVSREEFESAGICMPEFSDWVSNEDRGLMEGFMRALDIQEDSGPTEEEIAAKKQAELEEQLAQEFVQKILRS